MKFNFLTIIAGLVFTLTLGGFQTAAAQKKIPAKEASLVALLVKEARQPDAHSADDVYLLVTIGKTEYVAELKSGKIVSQKSAGNPSGGFSGAYAEVSLILLDKARQATSQGAGQILKMNGNNWKRIALAEGDYQCDAVKTVPQSVLKAFKVECF